MVLFGMGLAILAIGCGGGTNTIEGKVTKGGQPFAGGTDGDVNIVLTPTDGGAGQSFSGKAGPDGSFKIEKVPSGKYSVSATIYPKPPAEGKQASAPMPANKKLDEQWEVSSSNKSFTLEITKMK